MTAADPPCSPGSHPHADQPNWQPPADIGSYLANCRDGSEQFSERRAALLLGWPRIAVWRARLMANIPEDLFDRLLENGSPGSRQLALIGALFTDSAAPVGDEIERCPHCTGVLRTRAGISPEATAIISDWLDEQQVPV
jgi:hypothetical protein